MCQWTYEDVSFQNLGTLSDWASYIYVGGRAEF